MEADVILFHPYDRWGFTTMDAQTDGRYLRYAVARLTAYRNVWWSLANEYDLMAAKMMADWDRFFRIVQESDPYGHLCSAHNCRQFYDHNQPWVTQQAQAPLRLLADHSPRSVRAGLWSGTSAYFCSQCAKCALRPRR